MPCALDNGAFQCWKRGFPFMETPFLKALDGCYQTGLSLDFIVCPDLVARGVQSLDFSMQWAKGKLAGARLALAVQDGMSEFDVRAVNPQAHFSHLFVGESLEWKWDTAKQWVNFAHEKGMLCHIGRVGKINDMQLAEQLGADSIDSTSMARNDNWKGVIELANTQPSLFD